MARKKPTAPSTCSCGHPPLVQTPSPEYVKGAWFDEAAVDRVVKALRALPHTKGRWARRALELEPWQLEHIVAPVFGWRYSLTDPDPDLAGTRIVRTAWIEEPRKNGKSTLASGLGIVLLVADGERGPEVYAAAAARAQAKIVHEPAKAMVRGSPALRGKLKVLADVITVPRTGGIFRAVGKAADLAHGLNVSGAIIDEVHIHKTRDLIDALETGTGSREQPLVIFITTADEGEEFSIYAEKHTYTRQVAAGIVKDPSHFGVIWAAEDGDDPFDEKTWEKANPNLGVSVTRAYLQKEADKAKSTPSYRPVFERLHLNLRRRNVTPFLPLDRWDRAAGTWVDKEWNGLVAYGGLDLSTTTDLTAFALDAPTANGSYLAETLFWLPEERAEDLERAYHLPFLAWAKEGWLNLTEGNVVDYERVRADITRRIRELGCGVAEIAYDPWNATETVLQLEKAGFAVAPVRQGYPSLSAATKELERLVMGSTVRKPLYRHRGHPILRWNADCVEVRTDQGGNIKPAKPDRQRSSKRIDGIAAHVNAIARALTRTEVEEDVPELIRY